jgi:hypothetical protein
MDDARARSELFTAGGILTVIAVAGVFSPTTHSLGQVNVALLLAIVVAAVAAGGGRFAGAVSGGTAAVAYNFFQTEPVHSLRMDHGRDVVTVLLLAVVGVSVGELSRRMRRSDWVASRSDVGLGRVVRVAELACSGADSETLVAAVEEEIRRELRLASVRFELGGTAGEERPLLDHRGVIVEPVHLFFDDGFALPTGGVDLLVAYRGREFGRLVLTPQRPIGLPAEQLRCAVAIADQLAAALATMVP